MTDAGTDDRASACRRLYRAVMHLVNRNFVSRLAAVAVLFCIVTACAHLMTLAVNLFPDHLSLFEVRARHLLHSLSTDPVRMVSSAYTYMLSHHLVLTLILIALEGFFVLLWLGHATFGLAVILTLFFAWLSPLGIHILRMW